MQVHIILHRWSDYDRDGLETRGVYSNRRVAIKAMKHLACEEKRSVKEIWGKKFDSDFSQSSDEYISFGWYNGGMGPSSSWEWVLETEEVQ